MIHKIRTHEYLSVTTLVFVKCKEENEMKTLVLLSRPLSEQTPIPTSNQFVQELDKESRWYDLGVFLVYLLVSWFI